MSASVATSTMNEMKSFRSPKTVIGRLVARRTVRGAILWALVLGGYVASKSIGLVAVYPTTAARLKIAQSYGNNIGIEFLLGSARHVTSAVSSIAAWNTMGLLVIVGSIWGLLPVSYTHLDVYKRQLLGLQLILKPFSYVGLK